MSQTPLPRPDRARASTEIVTEAEWLRARRDLLVGESNSPASVTALAAGRRTMPMVEVTKNYVFQRLAGPISCRAVRWAPPVESSTNFMFPTGVG